MRVWMVWIRDASGYIWLEAAWDDDSTVASNVSWRAEVDRCRKLAVESHGDMRIMAAIVPGVIEAFAIPEVEAVREGE